MCCTLVFIDFFSSVVHINHIFWYVFNFVAAQQHLPPVRMASASAEFAEN